MPFTLLGKEKGRGVDVACKGGTSLARTCLIVLRTRVKEFFLIGPPMLFWFYNSLSSIAWNGKEGGCRSNSSAFPDLVYAFVPF